METKLSRIAEIASAKPREKFTSLYQLLNEEMRRQFTTELQSNRATGMYGNTKAKYAENLEENVRGLVER